MCQYYEPFRRPFLRFNKGCLRNLRIGANSNSTAGMEMFENMFKGLSVAADDFQPFP